MSQATSNTNSTDASSVPMVVGQRYRLVERINSGSYGTVWSAWDTHCDPHQLVAVKRVGDAFRKLTYSRRLIREILLLHYFRNCPNILRVRDIVIPGGRNNFQELYIVTDILDADLHEIIHSNELQDHQIRRILFQIVNALQYVHGGGVVHRDLKPSNVLVNADCHVELADFGLARDLSRTSMSEYVQTRWYRAPEVLLHEKHYTEAVDMWSVGCILAEMFMRRPLFPGSHHIHQLELIIGLTGTPPTDIVLKYGGKEALDCVERRGPRPPLNLATLFPNIPSEAARNEVCDFLRRCLSFDPTERMTVHEALAHPYLAGERSRHRPPQENPLQRNGEVDYLAMSSDENNVSIEGIKQRIYEHVEREFPRSLHSVLGEFTPDTHPNGAGSVDHPPAGYGVASTIPMNTPMSVVEHDTDTFRLENDEVAMSENPFARQTPYAR